MIWHYECNESVEMLQTKKSTFMSLLLLSATLLTPAVPVSAATTTQKQNSHRNIRQPRTMPHHLAAHRSTTKVGVASFYSNYYNGRKTANGERFNNHALTAASLDLPLGSRARVTNLANHRSVVVRVNDRGPYRNGRRIDVSRQAAQQLGFVKAGVTKVRITPLS